MRAEQSTKPVRRPAGAAGLLDLDPRPVDRQLELPHALPALRTPAKRDPRARERMVGGVVVDGREDTRLERLAAEVWKLEAGRRLELALVFDRGFHQAAEDNGGRPPDRLRHRIVTSRLPIAAARRPRLAADPPWTLRRRRSSFQTGWAPLRSVRLVHPREERGPRGRQVVENGALVLCTARRSRCAHR